MSRQEKDLTGIVLNEWDHLTGYVKRKLTNISHMDAEDIVADVVYNIYNKVNLDEYIESILAYAYRSIRNRIVDYLRRSRGDESLERLDASGMTLADLIPDPMADIQNELERDEIKKRLQSALMELRPKQREIWVATEIEGRTFQELSVQWREPIGTLLSRKSRAVKALRSKLTDVI